MKRCLVIFYCLLSIVCLAGCSRLKENQPTEKIEKLYGKLEMKNKEGEVVIDISHIESVQASTVLDLNNIRDYVVVITFTDEGSEKFAEVTKNHLGETLEIYVEDKLVSAPVISAVINNGSAHITGCSTYEDAEKLANTIRGKVSATTDN